jgi:hypothetical protein
MGFGLIIEFIELLQLVTASNPNALTNSHTQLFTMAHAASSVFTSCCLVMDPINIDCSASVFTFLPAGDCLTANP